MSDLTGPVEAAARASIEHDGGASWGDLTRMQKFYILDRMAPAVAAAIAQYETERADQ